MGDPNHSLFAYRTKLNVLYDILWHMINTGFSSYTRWQRSIENESIKVLLPLIVQKQTLELYLSCIFQATVSIKYQEIAVNDIRQM